MSNMSWLLCDVRWDLVKNQMAKPDIGAIGLFGRGNKYIKHRTTAIGQLTAALPTLRCQECVKLSLAKEGNLHSRPTQTHARKSGRHSARAGWNRTPRRSPSPSTAARCPHR